MKLNLNLQKRVGFCIGAIVVLVIAIISITALKNPGKGNTDSSDGYEVVGKSIKNLSEFKNIEIDRVVKASVVHSGEGGIVKLDISDKKRIKKLYNDIGNLKLTQVTDLIVMDAGESFVFEYDDGTQVRLYMEPGVYIHDGIRYITEGIIDESDLEFLGDVN